MTYKRPGMSPVLGGIPVAMLDVFVLSLLYVAVFSAGQAGVKARRFPELRIGATGRKASARPGVGPLRVELAGDGRTTLDSQAVPVADLADRLVQALPAGRPIVLAIEVDKSGSGPLEPFLQIQADFSQKGLWDRTTVVYRPATSTPREKEGRP